MSQTTPFVKRMRTQGGTRIKLQLNMMRLENNLVC